jgi:hypothetical protein
MKFNSKCIGADVRLGFEGSAVGLCNQLQVETTGKSDKLNQYLVQRTVQKETATTPQLRPKYRPQRRVLCHHTKQKTNKGLK